MQLDVPECVPDVVLPWAAAVLGHQGQRPLAKVTGPLVVTEQCVAPADAVEHLGLFGLMSDGLVEAERLFQMTEGVGVTALNLG